MEDARAPWATGEADKHSPSPDITQANEANLGPRRTSSPDSKLALWKAKRVDLEGVVLEPGVFGSLRQETLRKRHLHPTNANGLPIGVLKVGLKAWVILSPLLLYCYNSKITEHPRVTIGIR